MMYKYFGTYIYSIIINSNYALKPNETEDNYYCNYIASIMIVISSKKTGEITLIIIVRCRDKVHECYLMLCASTQRVIPIFVWSFNQLKSFLVLRSAIVVHCSSAIARVVHTV